MPNQYTGVSNKSVARRLLCKAPRCINVDHLDLVTQKENVMRAASSITTQNALKTHCKWGHELNAKNVYTPPKRPNRRYCIICRDARNMKARVAT